jgi:hypothetical protein
MSKLEKVKCSFCFTLIHYEWLSIGMLRRDLIVDLFNNNNLGY